MPVPRAPIRVVDDNYCSAACIAYERGDGGMALFVAHTTEAAVSVSFSFYGYGADLLLYEEMRC